MYILSYTSSGEKNSMMMTMMMRRGGVVQLFCSAYKLRFSYLESFTYWGTNNVLLFPCRLTSTMFSGAVGKKTGAKMAVASSNVILCQKNLFFCKIFYTTFFNFFVKFSRNVILHFTA